MRTDAELLSRYSATNDADAFAMLVDRHSGIVYNVALRITSSIADAEDVAQQCFLRMAQQAGTITTSLPNWLHRLARWRALDLVKSRSIHQSHEERAAEMMTYQVPSSQWNELKGMVDEAIDELPDDKRLYLVLYYLERKNHKEIAGLLGTSRTTVQRRCQEGVEELREILRRKNVSVSANCAALGTLFLEHGAVAVPETVKGCLVKIALAGFGGKAGVAAGVKGGLAAAAKAALVKTAGVIAGAAVVTTATVVTVHHFSRAPVEINARASSIADAASLTITSFAGPDESRGAADRFGSADGAGNTARFHRPQGLCVDAVGNVYVADHYNHTIRKITPAGVVTTLAGVAGQQGSTDGVGSAARFSYPADLCVDESGCLYIADVNNSTIRKITPAGVVTTLAGVAGKQGSADGLGSAARFNQPYGICVDGSGNVFVADGANATIRRITPDGMVTTFAGSAGNFGNVDGTGSVARFRSPQGICVDRSGNIYVADMFNNTIRKITPEGAVTTLAGSPGNNGSANSAGAAAGFFYPADVCADAKGNVYVADYGNNTIRKITPAGVVTTMAGSPGSRGYADGAGSAARFSEPYAICLDTRGQLYIAERGNHAIRKGVAAITEVASEDQESRHTDARR